MNTQSYRFCEQIGSIQRCTGNCAACFRWQQNKEEETKKMEDYEREVEVTEEVQTTEHNYKADYDKLKAEYAELQASNKDLLEIIERLVRQMSRKAIV